MVIVVPGTHTCTATSLLVAGGNTRKIPQQQKTLNLHRSYYTR